MTRPGEPPRISARTAALLASEPALRRLRVRHRADRELYRDLLILAVIGVAWETGHADATGIVIGGSISEDQVMTTNEAAKFAGVGADTIRRACRERRIAASQRDGRWLIPRAEAVRYTRREC